MPDNLLLVVTIVIVFAAFLLFSQFMYWSFQSRTQGQSRELARRLGTLVEKGGPQLIKGPAARAQKGYAAHLEDLIRQAGSPYPLASLNVRIGLAALIGLLCGVALFHTAMAVVGLALGYLPILWLGAQADERARKLAEQLPDGLDLLARSMQAGHGISEAMRGVADEMPMPLATEFGRVYEEHNLGRDFRECLHNLCARNPGSFDLQIFVSSVLLQRDTGGNLVEILNNISATIRQRFVFQGKVRALTSEARFTAYILGGLPFGITGIIATIQPNYLHPLFHDPLGTLLLLYCGVSFGIGVFLMRESAKVEL